MGIRHEVIPFIALSAGVGLVTALALRVFLSSWSLPAGVGAAVAALLSLYMLFFFRDPQRVPPADAVSIVAPADGRLESIKTLSAEDFQTLCLRSGLKPEDLARFGSGEVVRFSIFLSLFNVHVNRSPMDGKSRFLGYFPGKRLFTFDEKSSEENQHNAIRIENDDTCCLLYQIVGPVCRRVVYWPSHEASVSIRKGERIGMMKFGSRLDLYFPAGDITALATPGDKVRAGETVIARMKGTEK